jgi:uncharacterized membrane protein YoaK (UPF0700 family)
MKVSVPLLLSLVAGYVDTAGFLALQGLFTAHVTGNFVTAGAALVFGTSGVVPKLLALPMFCAVVALLRVLHGTQADTSGTRQLLAVELVLLLTGGILAIRLGPFPDGDAGPALITGMVFVCAMAVQNALQRLHLASLPPTTIMTGNTTQAVLDLVDVLRLAEDERTLRATRARLAHLATTIGAFGIGCGAAALLTSLTGRWCFAVPPVLILAAVLIESTEARPAS